MKKNPENGSIKKMDFGGIEMKVLKKVGWFIVSMLPLALSFLLNFGSIFAAVFIFIMSEMFKQGGNGDYMDLLNAALIQCYTNILLITVIYQITGLVIFGIWYYLAYGRKKRDARFQQPGIREVGFIILLGISIQFLTSSALNLIYLVFPDLLQGYVDLMEIAGLSELTPLSFLAAVILAPMGEEFLCRGVTFRIAGKVSDRFWIANVIQAFAFGVLHANLVQGIYAFLMGLTLGYIYGKYHNIWLCVLLHCIINSSSFLVDGYFGIYPEASVIPVYLIHLLLGGLLLLFTFKKLGKIPNAAAAQA